MSEHILLLVLAYVGLTALAAAALIRARLHWGLRLLLVLAAGGLYFVSYQGWREVQGWPFSGTLPKRFQLHAAIIEEPDKTNGSPGGIQLWLTDLSAGRPADRPRAYRIDYTKELHGNLRDALRSMRNGVLQLGRVSSAGDKPGMPRDFTRLGERREDIEFYALPDPALPEK